MKRAELMTEATIVATLMEPLKYAGEELLSLPITVKWLQIQADVVGDINPDWLRKHFDGKLIYTLRSREEHGACPTTTTTFAEKREGLRPY
jgi:hypothetical protein